MKQLKLTFIALLLSYASFALGPITGTFHVCPGSTTALSDITTGGTWSSSSSGVATVGATTGVVTGAATGVATISYTDGVSTVTQVITVDALPSSITGPSTVCVGGAATESDATPGGVWSSSAPAVLSISAAGVATAVSTGVCIITYALPSGCITTRSMTVNPLPAPITGTATTCIGSSTTLADVAGGGVWSSSNVAIASVGSGTGVVTGNSVGATIISYTLAATSCSSTISVTVVASPAVISGASSVCEGSTTLFTDGISGGTWVSSTPTIATVDPATGNVTGVLAGTAIITYTMGTGCFVTKPVTVYPVPAAITGITSVCVGGTSALADVTTGGTWSSTDPSVATVGVAGLVTGVSSGATIISYTVATGCAAATPITVNPGPVSYTVTSAGTYCVGGSGVTVGLSGTEIGVSYQLYNGSAAVGSAVPGTGSAISFGAMTVGTYSVLATGTSGCSSAMTGTAVVTVTALPTIAASSAPAACGSTFTLTASGGTTYSWSPATGLSCTNCTSPSADITSTTTYSVIGTDGTTGCTNTANVTITANRVLGNVTYSSAVPAAPQARVWLIQYNPADSSLTALDSTLTCTNAGVQYYEFDSKPAGSYMVKAKLLSAVAGTSDYVPTYGLSSLHWDMATSITHTSGTDNQTIDMIYGTVPSGPGFIGGLIVSGAGKGTSGDIPVAGMTVYLLNTLSSVITYAVTDASGMYSFPGLANGNYIIYPVDYHYATTASAAINLSTASETAGGINFKQHTTFHTITPYDNTGIKPVTPGAAFNLYPDPTNGILNMQWSAQQPGAAQVVVTDMMGRQVYTSSMNLGAASGQSVIDLSSLSQGVYFISIQSGSANYSSKIAIAK